MDADRVFRITVPALLGRSYSREYKNSVGETQWTRMPEAAPEGEPLPGFLDYSSYPQRFYRVGEE
jgi:hypothetical protein